MTSMTPVSPADPSPSETASVSHAREDAAASVTPAGVVVEPSLLDTAEESALRESARALLRDIAAPQALSAMFDGDDGAARATWSGLRDDLGVAGLLVPEQWGGAGAGLREAGVLAQELGRACAPGPFLTSSVVATTLLLQAGEHGTALLSEVAQGSATAALVLPWTAMSGRWHTAVTAQDGHLTGTLRSVTATGASHLLVPAEDDGLGVYLVEAAAARVEPVSSLDQTRPVVDVEFEQTPARLLCRGDAARAAIDAALLTGAAVLACEQVGIARWCLEHTVEYLSQRRQFGRIVGGYQALKHRMAQMFIDAESADAAARFATIELAVRGAGDPQARIAVHTAASFCSDAAVHAAHEALQLHGGVGMTWEYPVHLYLKRAKADQLGLGTPDRHRLALAELVDIPVPG